MLEGKEVISLVLEQPAFGFFELTPFPRRHRAKMSLVTADRVNKYRHHQSLHRLQPGSATSTVIELHWQYGVTLQRIVFKLIRQSRSAAGARAVSKIIGSHSRHGAILFILVGCQ